MDEKHGPPDYNDSQAIGVPGRPGSSAYIKPQARKPHDSAVTFEEYHYYAERTRQEELTFESPNLNWREVMLRKKGAHETGNGEPNAHVSQNLRAEDFSNRANRLEISDEEWTNASRAFRTASWGACECFLQLQNQQPRRPHRHQFIRPGSRQQNMCVE